MSREFKTRKLAELQRQIRNHRNALKNVERLRPEMIYFHRSMLMSAENGYKALANVNTLVSMSTLGM